MSLVYLIKSGSVKTINSKIWNIEANKKAWLNLGFREMTTDEIQKHLGAELKEKGAVTKSKGKEKAKEEPKPNNEFSESTDS
jgi:hypothetical protein